MQGVQEWRPQPPQEREGQPVDVGMDDVETRGRFGDCLEQRGIGGGRVGTRAAQPQGARPCGNQLGFGAGVPARKQRDLVAERDQLVCKP